MTQKQYEVGQVIMQMSRIFAKAMAECMKNSGLVDEGYVLSVRVQEGYKIDPGYTLTGSVTLEPKELGSTEEYFNNSFCNHYYEEKGWMVVNDPVIKTGAVPPVVRTAETAARVYGSRKEAEKEFAPDGLWISRYDDPNPVDGGV